jgi:hypothetical protein
VIAITIHHVSKSPLDMTEEWPNWEPEAEASVGVIDTFQSTLPAHDIGFQSDRFPATEGLILSRPK